MAWLDFSVYLRSHAAILNGKYFPSPLDVSHLPPPPTIAHCSLYSLPSRLLHSKTDYIYFRPNTLTLAMTSACKICTPDLDCFLLRALVLAQRRTKFTQSSVPLLPFILEYSLFSILRDCLTDYPIQLFLFVKIKP